MGSTLFSYLTVKDGIIYENIIKIYKNIFLMEMTYNKEKGGRK